VVRRRASAHKRKEERKESYISKKGSGGAVQKNLGRKKSPGTTKFSLAPGPSFERTKRKRSTAQLPGGHEKKRETGEAPNML